MATFPTDVAARLSRATLSCAVDHVPDAPLYKSTALEGPVPLPAVTPIRRQSPAPQTQQTTSRTPQTRKRHTIAHTHQPKQQPLNKQRQTTITCATPREDGHVPNRGRRKIHAPYTELRSRPCALRRGNTARAAQHHNRQGHAQPAPRVARAAVPRVRLCAVCSRRPTARAG